MKFNVFSTIELFSKKKKKYFIKKENLSETDGDNQKNLFPSIDKIKYRTTF